MKLCIECNHFVADGETCAAPQNYEPSPIDGQVESLWHSARSCRCHGCGRDGNWWEAKAEGGTNGVQE